MLCLLQEQEPFQPTHQTEGMQSDAEARSEKDARNVQMDRVNADHKGGANLSIDKPSPALRHMSANLKRSDFEKSFDF